MLAAGAFADEMQRMTPAKSGPRGVPIVSPEEPKSAPQAAAGEVERLAAELARARQKLAALKKAVSTARPKESKQGPRPTDRERQRTELEIGRLERALRIARAECMARGESSPYVRQENERDAAAGKAAARKIDAYVESISSEIPAIASDHEFCRRATLDLCGTIPTCAAAQEYANDPGKDKKERLIERLLAAPRFADYWALRVRQWMLDAAPVAGQGADTIALFLFLREQIAIDAPWHETLHALLTAEGLAGNDGAVSFALLWDAKPGELGNAVGRVFMGVDLSCAQCHDDPSGAWKQEDYWGIAAFFTGIESKAVADGSAYPRRPRTSLHATDLPGGVPAIPGRSGEWRAIVPVREMPVIIPLGPGDAKGKLMGPKPLGQPRRSDIPQGRRRIELAAWLARPDNPYLSRALVERAWRACFGWGFLPKADGFHPSAPIRHAPLLSVLESDLTAHGRRLKHLLRAIALSEAYGARAGTSLEEFVKDGAEAPVPIRPVQPVRRPLDSDQWHDAVVRATGIEELARGTGPAARQWAIDLQYTRLRASETSGPIGTALLEHNGDLIRRGLEHGTTLARLRALPPEHRATNLFWTVLSRPPTDRERGALAAAFTGSDERAAADLMWALLASTEFVTR